MTIPLAPKKYIYNEEIPNLCYLSHAAGGINTILNVVYYTKKGGETKSSARYDICVSPKNSGVVNNVDPAHEQIFFFFSALYQLSGSHDGQPSLNILL